MADFHFEKILYAVGDFTHELAPSKFSWMGVFDDQYTGELARLRLATAKGYPSGKLRILINQTPEILMRILPLYLEIRGRRTISVNLTMEKREIIVPVEPLLTDGVREISIRVKNPWRPSAVNSESKDGRVLGPQVEYLPATIRNLVWTGLFADHYIEPKAALTVTTAKNIPVGDLKIMIHQDETVLRKILPMQVKLKGAKTVVVLLTSEKRAHIIPVSSLLNGGSGQISFEVKNPWRPSLVIPNHPDSRLLGPQVQYLPPAKVVADYGQLENESQK
jgi:hypothetical protein